MTQSKIDLTDVEQGDRLTLVLESGERFKDGLVSGADIQVARDRHEKTYVSLTYEGGFWEQVNDRVESEVLTIRQSSGYGGEPLEQPRLEGSVWTGDGPENMQTPEYVELGTIEEVERHD